LEIEAPMTAATGPFIHARSTPARHALPRAASTATLRVRTVGRFDAASAIGGGEVQHEATVAALRESGVDARPWRPWEDRLAPGDWLHCFGSRPEFLPLVTAAKQQGARVAVSTIAWFDWRNAWREPGTFATRAAATLRYVVRATRPRTSSWRRSLYHAADLLLPNSQAEADQLRRLFEVPAAKIRIVPNGVATQFTVDAVAATATSFAEPGFVLCPGRIEPRKNQLALIRALADVPVSLVVLGDVVPGHERYAAECRRAAGKYVRFVERIEHDDARLAAAYASAGCVALVGWYETPGLAALEAAALGTPVVVPVGGSANEYFGTEAEYVGPHDRAAMRAAVLRSLGRGRRPEFARFVRENFTWRRVAEATREAYATVA
jgi:glycosyltransferase involved in cell wall biosynthesis